MFEDFSHLFSQNTSLSKEERAKLSNQNRAKSIIPKKKKRPSRPEVSEEEQAQLARKQRNAKSAENRKKAEKKKQLSEQKKQENASGGQKLLPMKNPKANPEEESPVKMYTVMRRNPITGMPKPAEKPAPQSVRGTRYTDSGKKSAGHRTSTLKAIFLGACASAMVAFVIYGRVQTNEVYSEIVTAQAEYDDMLAKNVSMRSEMEGKMTVKNVAEYAENVLGLKQIGRSQIQYIQIQTEDEVTIAEPETNLFVKIHEHLSRVWEFIKGE